MKHFDTNLNKLSNLFPDMGNLLENIKHVSNSEADIQGVTGIFNGDIVTVDVYILDTEYEHIQEDRETGISGGYVIKNFSANAKMFSDDTGEVELVGELTNDKFPLVVQVNETGDNLEEFVTRWLNNHADQYGPQQEPQDNIPDDIY